MLPLHDRQQVPRIPRKETLRACYYDRKNQYIDETAILTVRELECDLRGNHIEKKLSCV